MHQGTCCSESYFLCLFLEDVSCVSNRGDTGLQISEWQWLQWLQVCWQGTTWPTSSRRVELYLTVASPGCVNIAAALKAVLVKGGGYLWGLLSLAGSWNHRSSFILLLTAWQSSYSHWSKHCGSQPSGAGTGSSHPCCFYWLFFKNEKEAYVAFQPISSLLFLL